MDNIQKFLTKISSQIKKSNVKLPNKTVTPHKIKDNNQSISDGVINEKSNLSLRSAGKPRTIGG